MKSKDQEKDEIVSCPYNASHKLAKFKLLPHVHRCKEGLKCNKVLHHCKKDFYVMFFDDKKEEHFEHCKYCFSIYNNLDEIIDDNIQADVSTSKIYKKRQEVDNSFSFISSSQHDESLVLNYADDISNVDKSMLSSASLWETSQVEFGKKQINKNTKNSQMLNPIPSYAANKASSNYFKDLKNSNFENDYSSLNDTDFSRKI